MPPLHIPPARQPADLPEVVADMQRRIERLYAAKTALEQELSLLRAQPPVIMVSRPRPSLVTRVLMRVFPGLRRRRDGRVLRESGLFDADWYLRSYPDVARAGFDPVAHFLAHGARERRNPGPHFDTAHYLHLYPDIAQGGYNPLVHYVLSGRAEGRSIHPGMPHGGGPV